MATAGHLDENGVWIYGDGDRIDKTFSDLLNKGQQSVSDALAAIPDSSTPFGSTPIWMYIGDDMTVARPTGQTGPIEWIITLEGGMPDGFVNGDMISEIDPVPLPPVVIWSDSASVAGALGNTEVGDLPWEVIASGTAYVAEKVAGGVIKITTAGTGTCLIGVDSGVTDRIFTVTLAAIGTQFVSVVYPRYLNTGNYISLERTSSSDGTYLLRKRVANTVSTIASLTDFVKANGDIIESTTASDGTLIIKINGVEAYSAIVSDFAASATVCGFGVTSPSSATSPSFKNPQVTTLGG